MTTAYQIVTGALRLATVVAAGEQPTAEDMADGIEALNQTAAALKIDGIDLQWVDVDSNTELTLDDAYLKALKCLLAVDLAPEYGLTIAPAVMAQAEGGYRALQMAFTTVPDATFDTGIGTVGRKIFWNI